MAQMISMGDSVLRIKSDGKGVDYSKDGGLNWWSRTESWASVFGEITDLIDGGDVVMAQTTTGKLIYSNNDGVSWRLDKLFEPIKNRMARQAYSEWETCVNEHIIRAINVRLYDLYLDTEKSNKLQENDIKRGFIYIEPLVEKLKEFEKLRDEKQITFSEFYPELLDLLNSLLEREYWKEVKTLFTGPLNAVSNEEKIVYIYPTQDKDKKALKIAQDYALMIFNTFGKARNGLWLADSTALKTDLSEYGIYAYGTIESNLFLKHHSASFPFKIENQTIYANEEYTDKNTKLITCVPNPYNNEKGMAIYTALSNKSIKGINSVFHGGEDYIFFLSKNYIIRNGRYNKNEKWEF